jgi:predicted transcriptional regulator
MTSNNFDDFFAEIEAEANAEGPEAVRDLEAKRVKYRLINLLLSRRGELHLTQQQLAERSGVAQTEISRIERGRKSPTLDTYSRLASALDLEWVEPKRRATA